MTNEEAKNLIKRNRSVFQYDTEMLEALDIAIKALEAEEIIVPEDYKPWRLGVDNND